MGGPRKPADSTNAVDKPSNWEKAVLAAYFRHLGYSQKEAARHAGCGERTIQTWETCDWWPQAAEEGLRRWQGQLVALARRGLVTALKDAGEYASMSRWVAERVIKGLEPPTRKTQLTGKDEGPIEVKAARDENTRLLTRLAAALEEGGDSGDAE